MKVSKDIRFEHSLTGDKRISAILESASKLGELKMIINVEQESILSIEVK